MNKWKKRGSAALAGAMCLLTLAGCSGLTKETDLPVDTTPENSSTVSLGDGPIKVNRPDKYPLEWQDSYIYEYMGLQFQLDPGLKPGIDDGTLYMQQEALYNKEGKDRDSFFYAYQYLQYLPDDCEDMEYAVNWDEWLSTTQRIGTIGVYRTDYLADHPIESITGCSENMEVGRT